MKLPETAKGTKFENHCISSVWQWVVVGKGYYFGSRCVLSVESVLGEIVCFFLVWKNYLLTFFIVSLIHNSFEYWGNQIINYSFFSVILVLYFINYCCVYVHGDLTVLHSCGLYSFIPYIEAFFPLGHWLMDIVCIKHTISFHCISVTNVCESHTVVKNNILS
jgi:hypothetical protein